MLAKFPQVEKEIREHISDNGLPCWREGAMLKGAELALSALGEEPPTLTDEQVKAVYAAVHDVSVYEAGYIKEIVKSAFRLVFRSEPEIPEEVKPYLCDLNITEMYQCRRVDYNAVLMDEGLLRFQR